MRSYGTDTEVGMARSLDNDSVDHGLAGTNTVPNGVLPACS